MAAVSQLLAALPAHFSSVAPSLAAARQAFGLAMQFYDAAFTQRSLFRNRNTTRLQQQLVAVAQSMADLAPALLQAVRSGSSSEAARLFWQVMAACNALVGMQELTKFLPQLSSQAAFKLCAACSLAFGPGLALTELLHSQRQLPAAMDSVADCGSTSDFCVSQLNAVTRALAVLHASQQPHTAAAFASSTARPAALMPWLFQLCRAMAAGDASTSTPSFCAAVSRYLLTLLETLLHAELYAPHREWLAAHPDCQQAVADVLLQGCLPSVAAAFESADSPDGETERMLLKLTHVLCQPSLASPLQRLNGAAAVAAVQSAAAIVRALPVSRPTGLDAPLFRQVHACSVAVLYYCCRGMIGQVCPEAWPGIGGSGNAAAAAEPAGSAPLQQQAAACQLLALMPKLAATIQSMADDPAAATDDPSQAGPGSCLAILDAICSHLAWALPLLRALDGRPASAEQLARWAAATTAGLQLQPTLLLLQAKLQQPGLQLGGNLEAAARLSGALTECMNLFQFTPVFSCLPSGSSGEGALSAPASELWQLHSTAARLCHFLISRSSPALPGWQLQRLSHSECWVKLLADLASISHMAQLAMQARLDLLGDPEAGGLARQAELELQALRGAHVEAAVAVASAGDAAAATGPASPLWMRLKNDALLYAAAYGVGHAGGALEPSLEAALEAAWAQLAQDTGSAPVANDPMWDGLAQHATRDRRLVTSLACSSLFGLLLWQASRRASSGSGAAQQAATQLIASLLNALEVLDELAEEAVESAAAVGMPGSLAAQVQAAAARLQERQAELSAELAPATTTAERISVLQQLQQPAADLAALLRQHQALPAVEASRQLELARAAAARSCAFLRCTNVGGRGGPAAGQGEGSLRCGGCRAVWYCGAACQQADWRAGHKRVCKQLAAERRAAKQAVATERHQQ